MEFVFDDGGRAAAGYKGTTGDCVCRAISIATQKPYKEIYKLINELGSAERLNRKTRTGNKYNGSRSSARTGVYKETIKKVMERLGWKWTPTMLVGQGCKVHLRADELPKGRLVVNLSKHCTAVIDGVIHDIYDPNDRGVSVDMFGNLLPATDRCVYGYFAEV